MRILLGIKLVFNSGFIGLNEVFGMLWINGIMDVFREFCSAQISIASHEFPSNKNETKVCSLFEKFDDTLLK